MPYFAKFFILRVTYYFFKFFSFSGFRLRVSLLLFCIFFFASLIKCRVQSMLAFTCAEKVEFYFVS
jgi:hypothetical protein